MAKKLVDLDNIIKLTSALDSRMKNKIEIEELRARDEESNLLQAINEVKTMLGGKSLVYITQAEYDGLSEEEKNDEDIMYFITDAEDLSHTHNNLELLNSLDEEYFADLDSEITSLKDNKVNKSEYETKIGELTANITNEIDRAIEKENELSSTMSTEVARVEGMLGGKSLVYITQAEYDGLSEEERNNEDIMYFITDAEDLSHVHDNLELLNSLDEEYFADLDSEIISLKDNKVNKSEYETKIGELTTNITNEVDRATEKENEISAEVARVEGMLDGKSLVYITQAEYDNLTEEEKNNEDIMYFITDAEDLSHVHDNLEFLNSLNEESFTELSTNITSLENNKVNKSEYETKIGELTTNITNEVDRATEKENEISAEVARVEGMLGGKSLVYITQAEYDDLTEEEKNDEDKIYFITDAEDLFHTHANMDVLNQISNDTFAKIDADITNLDTNKMNKADAEGTFIAGDLSNEITGEEYKLAWLYLGEQFISPGVNTKTIFHDSNSDGEDENLNTYLHNIDNVVNQAVADITTLKDNKMNKADADAKYITAHVSEEEAAAGVAVSQLTLNGVEIKPVVTSDTIFHDDLTLDYCLEYLDNATSSLASSIGDGSKLLTDAKATVVDALNELQTEINVLQGDVDDFELALETVDAIKLNGYSIWVGTTEELNNIAQRDPKTLYFEINDEEDSEEVVQVDPVDGVLTLTTNKYQKTTIADGTEIVFPEVNKFTEIHLYFDAESAMNLTFPECKWRVDPNIEAGKSYEIVATYNTVHWLVNVIVYS